jgi:hypothetical protein
MEAQEFMTKRIRLALILSTLLVLVMISPQDAGSYYFPGPWANSSWLAGAMYQPFAARPLFGFGYPPASRPFGFGPQPLLSLLSLGGLSSYFNSPNPGYPYSAGGYNFSTLFASGQSPYPYASTFPQQVYPYLTPSVLSSPTYDIYLSPLTSTLAPAPSTTAVISGITTGWGGGGGLSGGPVI